MSADAPLCSGEELIYLDPHTTQPAVEVADRRCIPDESFHCQHPPSRMRIGELDPSIAVVRPAVCRIPALSSGRELPGTWVGPGGLRRC